MKMDDKLQNKYRISSTRLQNFASLRKNRKQSRYKNKFGPQSQNLASIIRGYKTGVKKLLNLGSSCIYPKHAKQPLKEESLLS